MYKTIANTLRLHDGRKASSGSDTVSAAWHQKDVIGDQPISTVLGMYHYLGMKQVHGATLS